MSAISIFKEILIMSNDMKPTMKRERRRLAELIPFPTQDQMFSPCSEAENDRFRENIRSQKLSVVIHVLPDNAAGLPPNTILSDHRRHRALMEIGFREYGVWVRYDLADATLGELECVFMDPNDQRRQLSQLELARIAVRRFEIELGKEPGDLTADERRDAIARVQAATDLEERNARRYVHIVHAPLTIQNAFEQHELTLNEASSLAVLPSVLLDDADHAIRSGKSPKEVAKTFRNERSKKIHRNAKPMYESISSGALRSFAVRSIKGSWHYLTTPFPNVTCK
jgi:hypothetical protein